MTISKIVIFMIPMLKILLMNLKRKTWCFFVFFSSHRLDIFFQFCTKILYIFDKQSNFWAGEFTSKHHMQNLLSAGGIVSYLILCYVTWVESALDITCCHVFKFQTNQLWTCFTNISWKRKVLNKSQFNTFALKVLETSDWHICYCWTSNCWVHRNLLESIFQVWNSNPVTVTTLLVYIIPNELVSMK